MYSKYLLTRRPLCSVILVEPALLVKQGVEISAIHVSPVARSVSAEPIRPPGIAVVIPLSRVCTPETSPTPRKPLSRTLSIEPIRIMLPMGMMLRGVFLRSVFRPGVCDVQAALGASCSKRMEAHPSGRACRQVGSLYHGAAITGSSGWLLEAGG